MYGISSTGSDLHNSVSLDEFAPSEDDDSSELEDSAEEDESSELEDSWEDEDSSELDDSTEDDDSSELEDSAEDEDSSELEDSAEDDDSFELDDSADEELDLSMLLELFSLELDEFSLDELWSDDELDSCDEEDFSELEDDCCTLQNLSPSPAVIFEQPGKFFIWE